MRTSASTFDNGALPAEIPIFPLPGALLLPRARMPLNIFEDRYLAMTNDALGGGRLIGMVQPVQRGTSHDATEVYGVGCLGRIVAFAETPDCRLLITLMGVTRFRIVGEVALVRGYRRVRVDYAEFSNDRHAMPDALADRPRLEMAVRRFFDLRAIDVDWAALADASDDVLVTSLAMVSPFETREKQAILECDQVSDRGAMLTTLLEMALHNAGAGAEHVKH